VAKKVLGDNPENIVVTDQYAGYHYIDADHRQLCWAMLGAYFKKHKCLGGKLGHE